MNGYDFDKTIFEKDSSTQFFVYMILSRPYLILFFPWFLIVLTLYGCKIIGKLKFKEFMFFFIPLYKNIDKIVNKFWEKHANGIKDWYSKQKQEDDIIISASLGFIIKPIMEMLNIKNWIATEYDLKSGKIIGKNCYGEEKVIQYKKMFGDKCIDAFYSDSISDLPMMKISKKAFIVDGNKITEIDVKKYL